MKIEKACLNCNQVFFVEVREVNRGNGKFCSSKCSGYYSNKQKPKPEPNVECAYCKVKFYKNESKKRNSKSGLYFCCAEHKSLCQRVGGIKEIMPAHYGAGTGNSSKLYRPKVFAQKDPTCERCGFNHNIASIVIHHKDRNRDNNDLSNLEVLCANCHAIEHWGKDNVG